MKKIAMIIVFALIAAFGAAAESTYVEPVLLEGIVTGITEEGYIVDNAELGEVMVLVNEETYIEATGDIACGDYVFVDYNGMMTRSLPPQINAMVIRMYKLEGDVIEADTEANTLLVSSPDFGDVIVNLPESYAGQEFTETHVTVYFSGAMTMSLPPQIGAAVVIPGYSMQGTVTEITDEYIVLGEGMESVQVNLTEGVLPEGLEIGNSVTVIYDGQMTRSIPAMVTADSISVIGAAVPAAEEIQE